MAFQNMIDRARTIRELYAKYERTTYGRAWSDEEIALGFAGDVGDLVKLVLARNGVRDMPDVDARLAHELTDCLWSLIVLADAYGIDLEAAFYSNMDDLETRLNAD